MSMEATTAHDAQQRTNHRHASGHISPAVWRHFSPVEIVPSWDWLCRHGRNWHGERFDPAHVPWVRGVCDAFDDPDCREIALQWAARLGKTVACHNLLCYTMEVCPRNILELGPTEKIALRWVDKKLYPMLRAMVAAGVKIDLPPENRQSTREINFGAGDLKAAWGGSDASMADFDAVYMHAGEVSKLPQQADAESDTLNQAKKRTHAHADRKILLEGTPTHRGRCRIERARQDGNDCRYWVPCPHCGTFQVLKGPPRFDSQNQKRVIVPDRREGGIVWQLTVDGRHDKEHAFATAVYVCPHCDGEVLDVHRPAMMRAGVWCPKGQTVDCEGQLRGTPLRSGRIWSSQLASWYSLDFRWGDVAELWVDAHASRDKRKTFVQLTAGDTYEHEEVLTDATLLAEILRGGPGVTPPAKRIAPKWARMLVLTSDVQKDSFPWTLVALGLDGETLRTHLADYGTALSWEELAELLGATCEVQGGGKLGVAVCGIDSGHQTAKVYAWCKQHHRSTRPVMPVKGSSGDMAGKPYSETRLGQDTRARRKAAIIHKGQRLLLVNTDFWEDDLASHFETGTATACAPACDDADLLADLLNSTVIEKTDSHGVIKLIWCRRDETLPVDHRDSWRYANAVAKWFLVERRKHQWPAAGLATPGDGGSPRHERRGGTQENRRSSASRFAGFKAKLAAKRGRGRGR